jgi:signal transduction histidine kinase
MNSLRRKIILGYSMVAALVVALSVLSLLELRLVEERIVAGEQIGEFFNVTLEIRRFEKNYFLYQQPADLAETEGYVARARMLLRDHPDLFGAVAKPGGIAPLAAALERYRTLLSHYARGGGQESLAAEIRSAGKEIVTVAEGMARAERKALQAMLDRHRRLMIGSVVVVAVFMAIIGGTLIRRVGRPLREMEAAMEAVAAGRRNQFELQGEDREIASLTAAFNRMLRELELRQGQLVRSEKLAALGTLLSGVAHEINNPLSNISTSCEILAEEVGAGGTAPAGSGGDRTFQQELIAQIDTETWRARRIVRSLLDYARDRDFKRETLPLAGLVEDTLRLLRGRIPAEVAVSVDIPADLAVAGDRQRLQQVLINLVGNAVEAVGGAGTIAIVATGTPAAPPAGALAFGHCPAAGVEIVVRDDGHGIAPDTLPRIFDPFFTTKDVGHGLGLGLFIVFEIVEEHGGCIAVESLPGRGSAFHVRLPTGPTESTEES